MGFVQVYSHSTTDNLNPLLIPVLLSNQSIINVSMLNKPDSWYIAGYAFQLFESVEYFDQARVALTRCYWGSTTMNIKTEYIPYRILFRPVTWIRSSINIEVYEQSEE